MGGSALRATSRAPLADARSGRADLGPPPPDNIAIGYLRGVVTLLVVAFHGVLAYYPGPFPFTPHVQHMSFPVLDPSRFSAARVFAVVNDIYFMSLMFFLSGLFAWPSLTRKGAARFVRDRVLRLGLPFVAAAGIGGALAYYPTYLQSTFPPHTLADYLGSFQQPAQWMSGAAWFVAILLLFDIASAGVFLIAPRWGEELGGLARGAEARPLRFFLAVVAISTVAYVPMALTYGQYSWWNVGPLWLQKSRALQYAVYFVLGVSVGATGLDDGLLSPVGRLARGWRWWALAAAPVFVGAGALLKNAWAPGFAGNLAWRVVTDFAWVLSCATSSFAMLAVFVRFARPNRALESLRRNAYGIYLVHYPIVAWLQYALLGAQLAAPLKALLVIVAAVGASWALSAAVRRIPAVAVVV